MDNEDEVPLAPFDHLVGESTNETLRKKILKNKFVEFSELLPEYGSPQNKEYAFKMKQSSKSTTLVRQKEKRNLPMYEWLKAYDIFTAIYLERATTVKEMNALTKSLLTYRRNIQDLKEKGYDWVAYDRHFRQRMEAKPIPWECLPQSLMLYYQGNGKPYKPSRKGDFQYQRGNSFRPQSKRRGLIPYGYCFSFHAENKFCADKQCKYSHKCFKCEQQHQFYKCDSSKPPKQEERPGRR